MAAEVMSSFDEVGAQSFRDNNSRSTAVVYNEAVGSAADAKLFRDFQELISAMVHFVDDVFEVDISAGFICSADCVINCKNGSSSWCFDIWPITGLSISGSEVGRIIFATFTAATSFRAVFGSLI